MNSRRNQKQYFAVGSILLLAIIALTIGYASMSQTLKITSSGSVNPGTWKVGFTTIEQTASGSATCPSASGTNSATVTISGIVLTKPGDSCTYVATVKNSGTISAKLSSAGTATTPTITGTGTNATTDATTVKNNTTFTITPSSTIDTTNDTLTTNATGTVTMKVTYNSGATTLPSASVTISNWSYTLPFVQA